MQQDGEEICGEEMEEYQGKSIGKVCLMHQFEMLNINLCPHLSNI